MMGGKVKSLVQAMAESQLQNLRLAYAEKEGRVEPLSALREDRALEKLTRELEAVVISIIDTLVADLSSIRLLRSLKVLVI